MKKLIKNLELDPNKVNGVIGVCIFGSYLDDRWVNNESDIDIMVYYREDVLSVLDTLGLVSYVEEACGAYFNYENIHVTCLSSIHYNLLDEFRFSPELIIYDQEAFNYIYLERSRFIRRNYYRLRKKKELWEGAIENGTISL